MDGSRAPRCQAINLDCRDKQDCPSYRSGVSCWSTNDVSCCRRNDKSRCCYCSTYLNFLVWKETGLLFRTKQESFEDHGFTRISKAVDEGIRSGQYCEVNWQSLPMIG